MRSAKLNIFEYRLILNEEIFNIHVDSSRDEWKKIVINNVELVNEKYTLSLNPRAYIIYYPITLKNDEIIIAIDDRGLQHEYDIYLNGYSLLNGKEIEETVNLAKENICRGFRIFFRLNWKKQLKENIVFFASSFFALSCLGIFTIDKIPFILPVSISIFLSLHPLFMVIEWIHNKNIVKKFTQCFREKIDFYMLKKNTTNRNH